MSESDHPASDKEKAPVKQQTSNLIDNIMDRMTKAISDADEEAAAERVAKLREARPEATVEALVNSLIRQKCLQTGAVGAVTSGAALIPGLGTVVALTFGVAADIGLTFKMQAELVLEIAAAHRRDLSPSEKRNAVLIVTGISAGANKLLEQAGERLALKATERLTQKAITKAIPVIGVAASAGANMLSTYIIGRRAHAYFGLGPEAVEDWSESIRAITGVDERIMVDWLTETTERSWQLASNTVQDITDAVIVAGRSAGEVVVLSAGKAGAVVAGAGRGIARGAEATADAAVEAGKKIGGGIAGGARKTGEVFSEGATRAGRSVAGAPAPSRDF